MTSRGLLLIPWLAASAAWAQPADILTGAPRTSIYVEASRADNDGRPDCDWYRSATQLINTADPSATPGCNVSIRIRGIINREGARYFTVAILVAMLNYTIYAGVLVVAPSIPTGFAIVIAVGFATVFSFLGYRLFAFKTAA